MRIRVLWRPGRNTEIHSRFSGIAYPDTAREEAESHRAALAALGHEATCVRWSGDDPPIDELTPDACDLVFNASCLAEVALLEQLGFCYAGSAPALVALDKGLRKRILARHGVPTPEHCVLASAAEAEGARIPFEPPYFVKPVAGRGSQGVTDRSVVERRSELPDVVSGIVEGTGQRALVERRITGTELTVGIVGDPPTALPVLEIEYTGAARANTFEHKQDRERFHCPARVGQRVCELAARTALATFAALGARDYGRVDMLYEAASASCQVLELNTFAGLHLQRGDERELHRSYIGVMAEAAGLGVEGVYGPIVEAASRRRTAVRR